MKALASLVFVTLLSSISFSAPTCPELFKDGDKDITPDSIEALYYNSKEILRSTQVQPFREAWAPSAKRIRELLKGSLQARHLEYIMIMTLKTLQDLYDGKTDDGVSAQLAFLDHTIRQMIQMSDDEFRYNGVVYRSNDKVSGVFRSRLNIDIGFQGRLLGVRKASEFNSPILNLVVEVSERSYVDFSVKSLREMRKIKR